VHSAFFRDSNYAEACLWGAIGIGFLLRAIARSAHRRDALIAGVMFLAFGGSDVVEASTSAWWRPWWLLVWKGLCLLVFAWLLVRSIRRRTQHKQHAGQS
jgi:hypothetical protein